MNPTRLSVALGTVATVWLAGATEALTEACPRDAGGGSWKPDDGPVWLLNPVGWPVGPMLLLAGLVLAATRSKWVGYAGAALVVSWIAVGIFVDLIPQHQVYRMQVEQGCKSLATDWAEMGVLALFALAYGWLGLRRHRMEVRRIVAARQNASAAQNI
jgi:hypothetical protein